MKEFLIGGAIFAVCTYAVLSPLNGCPVSKGDTVRLGDKFGTVKAIKNHKGLTQNCEAGVLWTDDTFNYVYGWALTKRNSDE